MRKRYTTLSILLVCVAICVAPSLNARALENNEEILNSTNCYDLSVLLSDYPFEDRIEQFASNYKGKTIEFDGYIANFEGAQRYRDTYNISLFPNDYTDKSSYGAHFQMLSVHFHDLGYSDSSKPELFENGTNVHVIGIVKEYDKKSKCITLIPGTIQPRDATLDSTDSSEEDHGSYVALEKGNKGEEVKALQQRLIDLYYLDDIADGAYGNKTKSAVEQFQKAINVEVTGIADPSTQARLFSESAPKKTLSISHSSIIIGSSATTVWSVDGQEFTLKGNNTKTIKTMWGTYKFDAFGNYEKID